ncbi:MAG: lytic transglycosylase domain-containing protein [Deltaproteobacteria bacterium]|nr:lytic transglycosylase domain-containing protein [Deltaproteobacteria bacterium]
MKNFLQHHVIIPALVAGIIALPAAVTVHQNYPLDKGRLAMASAVMSSKIADAYLPHPSKKPTVAVDRRPESKPKQPFERIINQAATTHKVDPALIKAIIMAESRYNPRAVSKRGAIGLMQLMPVTAKWLGVEDSFDPEENINGGVMYFRKLLDRFDGDIKLALAAYNAGSRYVRKYGGVPPFRQTQTYIFKVFKYQRQFRQESTKADKMA